MDTVPSGLRDIFSIIVALDRSCREQNPVVLGAALHALISENPNDVDAVIYTDGFFVDHHRDAWASIARSGSRTIQDASGTHAMTTSSVTMEIMAV